MSAAEVDALLERLVAQFESPYDFLRELVQNAMDAGSDRVEVTLESHPLRRAGGDSDPDADGVIFELTILDTGAGMDEAIIDQELTRLFASGKREDRTMAGGFGIGFVSVFAWEPEAVLVHTGRGGESWELVFYADRSFDKVALEAPVEGTTISLFRRGRASEREPIADAVRESLWRWCRFCPLEISFEDLDGDDPAELIQDSPEPPELGLGAGLTQAEIRGESTLRVSFAVPANAVFLRRGLILAEGGPKQLLASIAPQLGRSVEHLQVWADSPLLRTTMARDSVVDDQGRVDVERRLLELVRRLRTDLIAQLERLAAVGEGEGEALTPDPQALVDRHWTHERHALYAALHAHLELEVEPQSPAARAVLRDLAHAQAISLDEVAERMQGFAVVTAPPLLAPPLASASTSTGDRHAAALAALVRDLGASRVPVIAGDLREDRVWLTALAKLADVELVALERAIARVEPHAGEASGLCGLVETLLRRLGYEQISVVLGSFVDLAGRPDQSPLFGPEVLGAAAALAFHGGRSVPGAALRRRKLWLNRRNPLVEAAIASFAAEPLVTGLALTSAMLAHLDRAPDANELAKLAEALDRDAGGTPP
jgi:hypothetical protein